MAETLQRKDQSIDNYQLTFATNGDDRYKDKPITLCAYGTSRE